MARVSRFLVVRGSYHHDAPSDIDYSGFVEIDWQLCDRRGRPAPWLERRAGPDAIQDAEQELIDILREHYQ